MGRIFFGTGKGSLEGKGKVGNFGRRVRRFLENQKNTEQSQARLDRKLWGNSQIGGFQP